MKRNIDFKFHTIHIPDAGVTIGYIPTPTENGLHVKVATAWTNRKDQFVKARGREIVAGRLQANRNHVLDITLPNVVHPTKAGEYRELEERICDTVMDNVPKAILDAEQRAYRRLARLAGLTQLV